jgi:DNA-binding MarR family transcriptional regulator
MEHDDATTAQSARGQLIEDALEEVMQHGPTGMMRSVRRWSSGRLSMVNLHVLMALAHAGPLAMHAIAETLDVSGASTTGIVDRMEELGYVARQRDSDDRRVVRVVLTDAGHELIADMATERRERLTLLLAAMSDADLLALTRGLRALRRAREDYAAEHAEPRPREGTSP